ncbi:LysR family transcriptional regulator [Staphylococcus caprae]|uniref:LysR family transcriptional regulator n=1 Tax=Staphylococcus caprae TaxID=29380 RepID=UPI001C836E4B|nr:LysR family transcriptional regulator [Staphylococcus caprae]MBX5318854.1 LysR family transcriptional regulator [Staphylococcus caprae]
MNFEQLAYVKTVYEMESMIHASEKMHISQSAMSQSIANLEKEIGYKLFERSRKGTFLTEEGQRLIPYILEILESKNDLLVEVQNMKTDIAGTLKIATIPTLFHKIVPKALSHFKNDYPQVDVEVKEADREDIVDMVDKGDIDIGLIGKPETEENTLPVREISLNLTTKFKLLVPKKSKLTFRDYVNLEEIQDYPFILYDRGFYHHQLKEFEKTHGPLKIVFKTTNPIVLMRTVAEGLGVGIVSNLMVENEHFFNDEMIEAVSLGKPFDAAISFLAVVKDGKHNEKTIQEFINYLKNNE